MTLTSTCVTIDATDPKSGTAEFKATAVRVEKAQRQRPRDSRGGERRGGRVSVDVHLLDAEPTTAERDAIDAFLGPPLSSWMGADRVDDGHSASWRTRRARRTPPAAANASCAA